MSICRSCGAPVVWARTSTGGSMPVDADPSPVGNVELVDDDGILRATVHSQPPLGVDDLYVSHFATCPDANDWRR